MDIINSGVYNNEFENNFRNEPNVKGIYQNAIIGANAHFKDENHNLNFIIYSYDFYNIISHSLYEGEFVRANYSDYIPIPIVISYSLSDRYKVGDIIESKLLVGENVLCVITGILNKNETVITINSFGEVASIEALAFNTKLNTGFDFVLSCLDVPFSEAKWKKPMLITLDEDNLYETIENFNKKYSMYGKFSTIESMINQNQEHLVWRYELNLLSLLLFTIVLIFGVGGYILISVMQKRKTYSILFINGLPILKMIILSFVSNMIILIPPIIIGLMSSPYFISYIVKVPFIGFSTTTHLFVLLLIAFIALFSTTIVFVQLKNKSVIQAYREELK